MAPLVMRRGDRRESGENAHPEQDVLGEAGVALHGLPLRAIERACRRESEAQRPSDVRADPAGAQAMPGRLPFREAEGMARAAMISERRSVPCDCTAAGIDGSMRSSGSTATFIAAS
jgi:hypothetical protein